MVTTRTVVVCRKLVRCRMPDCRTPTRSLGGVCQDCLRPEPANPCRPTVAELAAFFRHQVDKADEYGADLDGDGEDVLATAGLPTTAVEFKVWESKRRATLDRNRERDGGDGGAVVRGVRSGVGEVPRGPLPDVRAGVPVVPDGVGGEIGRGVSGLFGAAGGATDAGGPRPHPGLDDQLGGGGGGETAGGGTGERATGGGAAHGRRAEGEVAGAAEGGGAGAQGRQTAEGGDGDAGDDDAAGVAGQTEGAREGATIAPRTRLARYWMGMPAGSVVAVTGRREGYARVVLGERPAWVPAGFLTLEG